MGPFVEEPFGTGRVIGFDSGTLMYANLNCNKDLKSARGPGVMSMSKSVREFQI